MKREAEPGSKAPVTQVSPVNDPLAVELEEFELVTLDGQTHEELVERFERVFFGVEDVTVSSRLVETTDGGPLGIYAVAISYVLPQGVPFGALASEVGREFLGATPDNSFGFGDGDGIYMRGKTHGVPTESVAFFVGEEVFVYVFGGSRRAPTQAVARELLEASEVSN